MKKCRVKWGLSQECLNSARMAYFELDSDINTIYDAEINGEWVTIFGYDGKSKIDYLMVNFVIIEDYYTVLRPNGQIHKTGKGRGTPCLYGDIGSARQLRGRRGGTVHIITIGKAVE